MKRCLRLMTISHFISQRKLKIHFFRGGVSGDERNVWLWSMLFGPDMKILP
jgi:hypothetical protein